MRAAGFDTDSEVDVMLEVGTEIFIHVALQTHGPCRHVGVVLRQLTTKGHLAHRRLVGSDTIFTLPLIGSIVALLTIPSLLCGVGGREGGDGIEVEPVVGCVFEIEGRLEAVVLLLVVAVVKLVEDVVVVGALCCCAFIIVVGAVLVVGRYDTAGVVGVVDGIDFVIAFSAVVAAELQRERKLLTEVEVEVGGRGDPVVVVVLDNVLVVGVAHGGVVSELVGAAGDVDAVVRGDGIAAEQLKPVGVACLIGIDGILELLPGILSAVVFVDSILIAHEDHGGRVLIVHADHIAGNGSALFGVHEIYLPVGISWTTTVGTCIVVGDDGLALTTLLCGDDDDAVGSASTIQCCCRGILEDVDTVYVLRVYARDGVTDAVDIVRIVEYAGREVDGIADDNAVDDPKRLAVADESTGTADAYLRHSIDFTTGIADDEVGDASLQHLVKATHARSVYVAHLHTGHGAGEVAAVELLVTGDDDIVEFLCVVFQHHNSVVVAVAPPLIVLHAYAADVEHDAVALRVDGELAVGISHRAHTIGAVADDSADDRLAALVHDDAHKVLAVTDILVVRNVGSAHDDDVVVLAVCVEAVPADKPVDDGHGGLVVSLERDAEVDIIIVVLYLQPRKLFHPL